MTVGVSSGSPRPPTARLSTAVLGALYLAAFAWTYAVLIAPLWSYSGLVDRPLPDGSLVVAYLLAWLPVWILPIRLGRPSDVVLWVLYLFGYVPGSVMPYYVLSGGWDLLPVSLALSAGFAILLVMAKLPRARFPSPLGLRAWYPLLLLLLGALGVTYIALTLGLRFDLPSFGDVYDVRAEYAVLLQDSSRLPAYALSWSTAAIGPALLALGLQRRRPQYIFAGACIQLIGYGLTGSKVAVLSSVLLVVLLYVLQRPRREFGGALLVGLSALMVISVAVVQWATEYGVLSSLFVRRLIALPGRLFALYTDFFTSNPTYELSHSVLGWLVDRPYALNPDNLIAYTYDGRIYGANAGIWADGMANFGLTGLIGFSLLLGLLLWAMDSVSAGRPLAIAAAVLGVASFSLVNSGLLTSVLTHGIAAAMFLVWLMPVRADETTLDSPKDASLPVPSGLSVAHG